MANKLRTGTAEADAVLVSAEGDPAAQGFSLVREWPFEDASQMSSIYASLLNVTSVANPEASRKEGTAQTYSGTFWVSEVSSREDALRQGSVRQFLVKVVEYSDESTANLPAEADARLVTIDVPGADSDIPGYRLTREWNYINPTFADSSIAVLSITETVTNAAADGQTYGGTWWRSDVVSKREQDNSVTIREVLTLTSSATLESSALLVSFSGTPDSDEEGVTLIREWKWILQTTADTLVATLNALESYSGPEADGQTYSGTYANSNVVAAKQADGTCTIRQALTLTTADVAEGDAVLVSIEGDPQVAGYRMVREWRYLLDTAADTLFTTLNGTASYTNPQADGQTYTGVFAVATHAPQKKADRTVTIRQVLTKVIDLTTGADQAAKLVLLQSIPPRIIRERVHVNELQDAFSWNATQELLTLVYDNISSSSNGVLLDSNTAGTYITDANLIAEASANADTQSWQLLDRKFEHSKENVGRFICRFADPDFVAYSASNLKTVTEINPVGYTLTAGTNVGKENIRLIKGLDVDNIVSNVAGVTASSGYALDSVQGRIKDGEAEISVREIKTLSTGNAPTEETIFPSFRNRREQRVYVWKMVASGQIATDYTTAQTIGSYTWLSGAANYTVVSARKVLHKNGTADIISRVEKTSNTSTIEVWEAFDKPTSWIEKSAVNPTGSTALNATDGYWWRKWYENRRCGHKTNAHSANLQAKQGLLGSFVKPAGDMYYYERVTLRYATAWKTTSITADTANDNPFIPAYYKAPS